MKINKTFAAILAMAALPSLADVEALYWQVTSDMNTAPVEFAAAAMVADDGNGNKVYLNDSNGNAWQAANSDKVTTESIASLWSDTYASGYTFYIELMNNDNGFRWLWFLCFLPVSSFRSLLTSSLITIFILSSIYH